MIGDRIGRSSAVFQKIGKMIGSADFYLIWPIFSADFWYFYPFLNLSLTHPSFSVSLPLSVCTILKHSVVEFRSVKRRFYVGEGSVKRKVLCGEGFVKRRVLRGGGVRRMEVFTWVRGS